MGSKTSQKTVKAATKEAETISLDKKKIKIGSFKYKKYGQKSKTTFADKELDIPDRPGEIVRVYLDKDGKVTTDDGDEHELILAEYEQPHDESEDQGEGKKPKKKAVDFSKISVTNYQIPERE